LSILASIEFDTIECSTLVHKSNAMSRNLNM